MSDDRRIGRFFISQTSIERDADVVRQIMGACIIVRCELMYAHDNFEYIALSDHFDEVPRGVAAPDYDVLISTGFEKGWQFKRVK